MSKSPLLKKIKVFIQQAQLLNENSDLSVDQIEDRNQSRRDFLKSSLITSSALVPAVAFLNSCVQKPVKTIASEGAVVVDADEAPIMILGAGIAGLTAAYELCRAGIPCAIFEASSRVGGRMFTKTDFNSEAMTCELGGELVDSNHEDLIRLCRALGVSLDHFLPGDRGLEQNLYYLNQRYHTDRELIPLFKPFAKKLAHDQKQISNPKKLQDFDHISLEEYLQQFYEVEPWIVNLIRVAYVGECGLDSTEQSALNLIQTLTASTKDGFKIYGDSDQSMRIRGGNIALIAALENFVTQKGVKIYRGSPVVAFKSTRSAVQVTVNQNGTLRTFAPPRIICTIPFSVLRNIEGVFDLAMNPLKKKCIQELGYGSSSKMMIGYKSKIWRKGIEKAGFHIPASNGMVYTDLDVQNVWETSRAQKGNSGILTCYTAGTTGAHLDSRQFDLFANEVDDIFPGTKENLDGNVAAMNWLKSPFALGAYACSKVGQVTGFKDISTTPELSNTFIFAGEHAADSFQGFMNGACRSGKKAASLLLKSQYKKGA